LSCVRLKAWISDALVEMRPMHGQAQGCLTHGARNNGMRIR